MSYIEKALHLSGRQPLRLWCDCAVGSATELAEHVMMAAIKSDPPMVGELLSISIRCEDCGNERVLD